MPYLIPPTLPFTLPTCLLFACTLVYGRLSSNQEITALKAGGISVVRVLWPAIFLAALLVVVGVHIADQFTPACNRRVSEVILADMEGNIYAYLNQFGSIAEEDFPYEIYVQRVRNGRLIRPIFKHRTTPGHYNLVVQAEEATLRVFPGPRPGSPPVVLIHLENGVASTNSGGSVQFSSRAEQMPFPKLSKSAEEKLENLTFAGCLEQSRLRRSESQREQFLLSCMTAGGLLTGDAAPVALQLERTARETEVLARKAREAEAEVHLRLTQAVVALPFVLLGCPIGIIYQRRDFLHTFFVCFLPIITIYYPLIVLGYNVFKEGAGETPLSLWGPLLLMTLIAIPFLRRMMRY